MDGYGVCVCVCMGMLVWASGLKSWHRVFLVFRALPRATMDSRAGTHTDRFPARYSLRSVHPQMVLYCPRRSPPYIALAKIPKIIRAWEILGSTQTRRCSPPIPRAHTDRFPASYSRRSIHTQKFILCLFLLGPLYAGTDAYIYLKWNADTANEVLPTYSSTAIKHYNATSQVC